MTRSAAHERRGTTGNAAVTKTKVAEYADEVRGAVGVVGQL
jgi:hypothetical protein